MSPDVITVTSRIIATAAVAAARRHARLVGCQLNALGWRVKTKTRVLYELPDSF